MKALAYAYNEEIPMVQDMNSEDLHTTLPMHDLIGLFESEIGEIVDFDSFEYEHSQKAIHIFHGTPKLHKCRYKIKGSKIELGQITLTRKSPFADDEINIVERALVALSIHLNNAAQYQSGLKEDHLNALKADAQLTAI